MSEATSPPDFSGGRTLPWEQRDKRAKFWHKTYLEAFLDCMNASPTKENVEASAKFATLFADFTLKEMIARGLV